MMLSTQRIDNSMDATKTLRIQGYSISFGEGERALKVLDDINLLIASKASLSLTLWLTSRKLKVIQPMETKRIF